MPGKAGGREHLRHQFCVVSVVKYTALLTKVTMGLGSIPSLCAATVLRITSISVFAEGRYNWTKNIWRLNAFSVSLPQLSYLTGILNSYSDSKSKS